MALKYKLLFTYPYNFCYSVFALHRIHMIFCVLLLTQILELHAAKDVKMSHSYHLDLNLLSFFPPLTPSPIYTPLPFSVRESYGVNMGILLAENQNVLHEISVGSFSLLFRWWVWLFDFVLCFTYLDLDLLRFLLLPLPPFGFPPTFLTESYGVNVGMYFVTTSHCHTYETL